MNIKFNDKALLLSLDRKVKKMPQMIDRALSLTAQQGINIILDRTAAGKGINAPFQPYNDKYAKFRAQRGRQIAPVDLNFTGRMLASMSTQRIRRGVQRISFNRAEEARKAYFHNVTGAGKGRVTRKFFGFNQAEKSRLSKIFKGQMKI